MPFNKTCALIFKIGVDIISPAISKLFSESILTEVFPYIAFCNNFVLCQINESYLEKIQKHKRSKNFVTLILVLKKMQLFKIYL